MMQTKTRGVTVVSGELASSINSDYDYVFTSIAVSDVVSSIREVVEPFIGKHSPLKQPLQYLSLLSIPFFIFSDAYSILTFVAFASW